MQTANVNPQVTITCRHMELTDAIRDYAEKKIEGLRLDYPRIIEARVVLDVQNHRRIAGILLFCANHITIDATTTHDDLYAAIDETISKIARRMRKHKTRLMKRVRPRNASIRHITEQVFHVGTLEQKADAEPEAEPEADAEEVPEPEIEPDRIHPESYQIKPLYREEALMELDMNDMGFVVFHDAASGKLSILYRRSDGDFGLIEPEG